MRAWISLLLVALLILTAIVLLPSRAQALFTSEIQLTYNGAVDSEPVWSSDGTKIAFTSDRDGDREIFVMNTDGSNQVQLTFNTANDTNPAWNGTKIAFTSDRDGDREIFVMNTDGSNQVQLTFNGASDTDPTWKPDGTKIAFTSDRDGDREIFVMNADGSAQTQLTHNAADDAVPSWSPDGTKIAFTSDRDGDPEIFVMNTDGSNQVQLTFNGASDTNPTWRPLSTKITFDSDRDGDPEIYWMTGDGSYQVRLTSNPAADIAPSWSLDGTEIAFSSNRDGDPEIFVGIVAVGPPIARAGPGQHVSFGDQVVLDGSASSDPDDPPESLSYQWTTVGGVPIPVTGCGLALGCFVAPSVVITLTFRLTVTDPSGNSDTDAVGITVLEDLNHAVFVSSTLGDDLNDGSMSFPVQTLEKAFSLASTGTPRADIYVHEGDYTPGSTLTILDGMSIYGGFEASRPVSPGPVVGWTRTATTPTRVSGASSAIRVIQISTPTIVDGLTIQSAQGRNGPWTDETGNVVLHGENSIVIYVRDASDDLEITNNVIVAGRGGDGVAGISRSPGESGSPGGDAYLESVFPIVDVNLHVFPIPTFGRGSRGASPCGDLGGLGGSGGESTLGGVHSGEYGEYGMFGTPGGSGGGVDVTYSGDVKGGSGDPGQAGAPGLPGEGGVGAPVGDGFLNPVSFTWESLPGADGGDGTCGNGGGGGGGGGGGQELHFDYLEPCPWFVCPVPILINYDGAAGGGGGGAGSGGTRGGHARGGGGGSFGIFLWDATPKIRGNDIQTVGGGTGGQGGRGGDGGPGGSPGQGIDSEILKQKIAELTSDEFADLIDIGLDFLVGVKLDNPAGDGARGGNGGWGGPGGGGGGAAGGASCGIYFARTTMPGDLYALAGDTSEFNIGPTGRGGMGGDGGISQILDPGGKVVGSLQGKVGGRGADGITGETCPPPAPPIPVAPSPEGGCVDTVRSTTLGPLGTVKLFACVSLGPIRGTFASRWAGSDVVMTLTSPSGRTINRSTVSADLVHIQGPAFEFYIVSNPEEGVWTIELFGADVPETGEVVSVAAWGASPNRPPVAAAGPDTRVECSSPSSSLVSLSAIGSSDPDQDALEFEWRDNAGTVVGENPDVVLPLPLGVSVFTLVVSDGKGASATDSIAVTVVDTTPPLLSLAGSVLRATVPKGATSATMDLSGIASATDSCSQVLSILNDAPESFPIGSTPVTFTVTDAQGNIATARLLVEVVYQNALPSADPGPPAVWEGNAKGGANVSFDGTASSDPDGDLLSYQWTGDFGSATGPTPTVFLSLGCHIVYLEVADSFGGADRSAVVLCVVDTTPPTLTVPADMSVEAISSVGAVVDYGTLVSATDVVGAIRGLSCTPVSGSTFPIGTTTVTCTATDSSGLTATATFTVTVRAAPLWPLAVGIAAIAIAAIGGVVAILLRRRRKKPDEGAGRKLP